MLEKASVDRQHFGMKMPS